MKFTALNPNLYQYLVAHNRPIDGVMRDLREETRALGGPAGMQVAVEQGALLQMLAQLTHAKFAVEVGTFTGYSALCIARGLAEGGRLLCCDVSEEWTAIARRHWARAGVDHLIDLKIAPALDTLRTLPSTVNIDFAFIDADKQGYLHYYEQILMRMRPGGLVVFDNVLWGGDIINSEDHSDSTVALRKLNDYLLHDQRVDMVMLPVADGLTLARKR